jgi:flagellar basal body rod protein FlgC
MITDAVTTALAGMQRNQDSFARHAHRIANAGGHGATGTAEIDTHKEMAGVLTSRRGWEANAAVLRAADEMVGTLVDMLA